MASGLTNTDLYVTIEGVEQLVTISSSADFSGNLILSSEDGDISIAAIVDADIPFTCSIYDNNPKFIAYIKQTVSRR